MILRFAWGGELSGFPYRLPWSVAREPWIGSLEAYTRIWRGLFGYLSLIAIANAFTERWRDFVLRYVPYFVIVVAQLIVPLDTHVVRVGRCLGLTHLRTPGWHMAAEITATLRRIDLNDPVRYDYALYSWGLSLAGAAAGES